MCYSQFNLQGEYEFPQLNRGGCNVEFCEQGFSLKSYFMFVWKQQKFYFLTFVLRIRRSAAVSRCKGAHALSVQ